MKSPRPFAERVELARAVLANQATGQLPVWLADQAHAAANDTTDIARAIHRAMPHWSAIAGDLTDADDMDRSAMFVAAWMAHDWRCPHVRAMKAPAPVIAHLTSGRTYCVARCGRSRFRPLNMDRCDLCGEVVPSNQFVEFVVQIGGVLFAGNAGDCCAERAGVTR